jgi:hypothetical protein
LPYPKGPNGAGNRNSQFINQPPPLVPKMHYTKFEKNWRLRLQAVVIKKMLKKCSNVNRYYIPYLVPPRGQNHYPEDNEMHNFGRGLPALHHHAFSFSYIHVVSEKIFFQNWSILTLFAPPQRPQGGRKPEIHNLCPPCPNDALQIPNLKRIGAVVIKKTLKKCSNVNKHCIPCLAPPWGQNVYPKDNEIHNFGRGLPALHHHAFTFFLHTFREDFFKSGRF